MLEIAPVIQYSERVLMLITLPIKLILGIFHVAFELLELMVKMLARRR